MLHFLLFLLLVFFLFYCLYWVLYFLVNLPRYVWEILVEMWTERRAVLVWLLQATALILFYAGSFWLLNVLVEDPSPPYWSGVLNLCMLVHYVAYRYLKASMEKSDE